jgi:hypothetical protein
LLRRVRDCLVWWSSQDPRERALLNLLLITYYDTLVILALAFVGLPMLISVLVFDVYSIISQFAPIPVRYLDVLVMFLIVISVFSTGYFKRALLQCDRLDCFLVGKPLYYIMILDGVLMSLVDALIVAIASYLILSFVFGFDVYASLLLSLMLAIPTFALVTLVYFRKPWYMMPLLLPLFAIVYFITGVTNLFQWYLRKREELLARGVCKLNDGA